MDLGLRDRVVLVTGAAGRIGPVICATFAREGAAVGVVDVDGQRASATALRLRETGGRAVGLAADVSSETDVDAALRDLTAELGPVDVLVNAHGIAPNRSAARGRPGRMGPNLCRQHARDDADLPGGRTTDGRARLRGLDRERVVRRGSVGTARRRRYSGSKAAINMLTAALAIELGPYGIRVNAVAPGLVTDAPLRATDNAQSPYIAMMLQMTPLGRTGGPSDIAEVVVFLASERNAWMTGSIVDVSGGSHTGRPHAPLP